LGSFTSFSASPKGTADGGKSGIVQPHLQDLFQKSTEECSPEESQIMAELFQKFSNTFSKDEIDLGRTTLVEHHIDTGDGKLLVKSNVLNRTAPETVSKQS
jgi:hypothetical protein